MAALHPVHTGNVRVVQRENDSRECIGVIVMDGLYTIIADWAAPVNSKKWLRRASGHGMLDGVIKLDLSDAAPATNKPMATPITNLSSPRRDRCAACGATLDLGYYFFRDRPDRYCKACIESRPRCDACSAPVGEQHWTLHDGRVLCARCHNTAIYDPALARSLFDETVVSVVRQLGLSLRVGVEFRLVDAPSLAQVRASANDGHAPDEKTLGLYHRQGRLRAIYVLYGLPMLTFRTVVAHEYAHAWQGETCPLLEDDRLREGFAEWVAYRHLLHLGCSKEAQRMITSSHPYRPLLEEVLAIDTRVGPAGVVEHILAAGRGARSVT